MSSAFPNAINYFVFKNISGRVIYLSWKNIWEWKILDCMSLSCHVRVSTLYSCLNIKELLAQNRHDIWSKNDCNGTQPHSLWKNVQPFSQTGQMIELWCEYVSVRCIWLYVIMMSRTHFRVYPHYIVSWMSRKSLLETGAISEV